MNQDETIDTYISTFPKLTQELLQQMRSTIKEAAPDATEAISYAIPTFKWKKKNLVHFAAYEKHIGFYPAPVGISDFAEALSTYKTGKGSVQFPLHEPLPIELIIKMVKHRLSEIENK